MSHWSHRSTASSSSHTSQRVSLIEWSKEGEGLQQYAMKRASARRANTRKPGSGPERRSGGRVARAKRFGSEETSLKASAKLIAHRKKCELAQRKRAWNINVPSSRMKRALRPCCCVVCSEAGDVAFCLTVPCFSCDLRRGLVLFTPLRSRFCFVCSHVSLLRV